MWVLVVGLTVAIVFMAMLSTYIAGLLAKHHWITWIGLLIVLYVAVEMIWSGAHQVGCQFVPKPACDAGALRTLSALLSSRQLRNDLRIEPNELLRRSTERKAERCIFLTLLSPADGFWQFWQRQVRNRPLRQLGDSDPKRHKLR